MGLFEFVVGDVTIPTQLPSITNVAPG